jgi:hypothetical protein
MKSGQRKPLEMHMDDPMPEGKSSLETIHQPQKNRRRRRHSEITVRKRDKVRAIIVQMFYIQKAAGWAYSKAVR